MSNALTSGNGKSPIVYIKEHSQALVGLLAAGVTAIGFTILGSHKDEAKKTDDTHTQQQAAPQQPGIPNGSVPQNVVYVPQQQYPNGVSNPQAVIPQAVVPQQISKQFFVQSAKQTSGGLIFLNDTQDYKMATTTVVVRNAALLGAFANNVNGIKGHMVTVVGTASSYRGKPQIEASSVTVQ